MAIYVLFMAIYVLFEVTPKIGRMEEYLSLAAGLMDELKKCPGFIRAERFKSVSKEVKLLSLSVWENKSSVSEWRSKAEHRMSQLAARDSLFESYSIAVASGLRSYGKNERCEAPPDSNAFFCDR
ncbi:MAG: antibiotic biosynthesis monooxygenase [Deltaproteobacteria bacterium]|jgi:heme-degrading monooxygenase HmoA|nr:antibiotic biosynthesis monooxygenase [Deltaproteobacteria bacterium]